MTTTPGQASGFLWGYAVREGEAIPLTDRDLAAHMAAGDTWLWLHFPLSDQRGRTFIENLQEAPAAARDVILSVEPRVQLQFADGWAYGVLPDLERDLDGRATGPGRLQFAAGEHQLITARRHALLVVDQVRREAADGAPQVSPAWTVIRLIERFIDAAERRLHEIAGELDHIEDHLLDDPGGRQGAALGPLRREISRNHREYLALRSALSRALSPRAHQRAAVFAEELPRLIHEAEDLDRESVSLQERARLLHEEIDTKITVATQRSMQALTILSTMLIPPTLIVGAFGMNLPGIPFANSHAGFAAASVLCLAVVGGGWYLLRRMGIV